jgi:hypothetical protein
MRWDSLRKITKSYEGHRSPGLDLKPGTPKYEGVISDISCQQRCQKFSAMYTSIFSFTNKTLRNTTFAATTKETES